MYPFLFIFIFFFFVSPSTPKALSVVNTASLPGQSFFFAHNLLVQRRENEFAFSTHDSIYDFLN